MKAVVFHGIGDIRVEDVPEPRIQEPTDAIVRLTAAALCGTDLHLIRGTVPGMKPGTILGHEGVGVVDEVGPSVRNFKPGDRVVIASTIACGYCAFCRDGFFSQCDNANPNGPRAGAAYFGGPESSGSFPGLQAEKARVPYANIGLYKLPSEAEVDDDKAIFLSDVFPTGYFGAELADIQPGDTVAVFGCGPVGQFAIASAQLHAAGRILAVDAIPSRLEMARAQGAEVINFELEDPVETILSLTGGAGADRAIDAVGVDANLPHQGPAALKIAPEVSDFREVVQRIVPQPNPQDGNWHPGDAPSLAAEWAVRALAKAGTLAIVGLYPQADRLFPLGEAMNKNLTIRMGVCNHRKYIPLLLELLQTGAVDPTGMLTQVQPMNDAVNAYRAFDQRQPGWLKVEVVPGM